MIWLVHLLDDPGPVLAEAVRVVRPGGVLVLTVNKNDGHFEMDSDLAASLARARPDRARHVEFDDFATVTGLLRGLELVGETTFSGVGQGVAPAQWRRWLAAGTIRWMRTMTADQAAELDRSLAALPHQEVARADPRYRLVAFGQPLRDRSHPTG
ncbi:class I SAM-dependent methyltransferase [Fodinicola feengrottensis]|nr:hypothetical protein [Fodinicola feengrottensis]